MTPAPRLTAILAAALYTFAGTASAAPAPVTTPPAPVDPKPSQPLADPKPADPLATPEDPSSSPDPAPEPTAKKPDDPGLSEADTLVVRAGLDIDTADAGPSGPVIVSRMEELGNLELRRAEILPGRLGNDPVIRIRVSLQPGASDVFVIHSDVAVRGETVEGSAHDVSCSLCTEGEVVERARGEIVRLVPYVRARFRAVDKPIDKPKPEGPKPDPRALSNLGKAGIGLLAGGTLAFAAGLGLALSKPRADPDNPTNIIETQPAGYAVLAVGGAALVTGAVLLVLDRRKAKRNAQLAPLGAPGTAGLMLFGRF
jgi:hypothetical protein